MCKCSQKEKDGEHYKCYTSQGIDNKIVMPDPYLNMELGIPGGTDAELKHEVVEKKIVNIEGNSIDRANDNPRLDLRSYKVEYWDGETGILTANIIVEHLPA